MEIVFWVLGGLLVIGAVFLFLKRTGRNPVVTKLQKALAVFQIALGGYFFVLCLSDVLDHRVSFSAVRTFLNIFYALAFLSLTVFALTDLYRKKEKHVRIIVCFCAALIAAQCFIFPYGTESELKRICEAAEGIAVFTLLVILALKTGDEKYGRGALFAIVLLELAVAVLNTVLPMASVTADTELTDIPMNYLALYMRPVIFSSLALIYRIWMDLRKRQNGQGNPDPQGR